MKLVVTGAGGFLGAEVVRQANADPRVTRLVATDLTSIPDVAGVEQIMGDLRDPALRDALFGDADVIIQLATVPGAAAEADPVAAREVNVDVPLAMIDALRGSKTRLVFASSVAVLGSNLPDPVTDATPSAPVLVYGAQKAMIELALSCEVHNRRLDAVSLRPAGIVARDGRDAGLKSAFLSRLFWAFRRNEAIDLPLAPQSRVWLTSVSTAARNFLHAAFADSGFGPMPITLPMLTPRIEDLVASLSACFPRSLPCITYTPDIEFRRMFGDMQEVETGAALQAGFAGDQDLKALIAGAMMGKENA